MKGKPVGDIWAGCETQPLGGKGWKPTRTEFGSPRQKRIARTMANPVAPLSIMVVRIARGTFNAAFSISSDIYGYVSEESAWREGKQTCTAASAPTLLDY